MKHLYLHKDMVQRPSTSGRGGRRVTKRKLATLKKKTAHSNIRRVKRKLFVQNFFSL